MVPLIMRDTEGDARRPVPSPVPSSKRFPGAALAAGLFLLLGSCERIAGPSPDRTLTVELTGYGKGSVTSQPAGIDCRSGGEGTCSADFPEGTLVALTGTPDERSTFGGWSQGCTGAGACAVTLDANRAVGAAFDNPRLASARIGPAGGNLRSLDERVTLSVPAGALSSEQAITIEAIEASELGPEFREVQVERAYRLGPEGLAFATPATVSMRSDQAVLEEGDSLGLTAEFLLSSRDGRVETLDELMLETENGERVVRGAIRHFSPLVAERLGGRIRFYALRVPRALGIEEPWSIEVRIFFSGTGPPGAGRYQDLALHPLRVRSPLEPGATGELRGEIHFGQFSGHFTYTCVEVGTGDWRARLSLHFPNDASVVERVRGKGFGAVLERDVECRESRRLEVGIDGEDEGWVFGRAIEKPDPDRAISCQPVCEAHFARDALVELKAEPFEGFRFVEWREDCSGTNPTTTARMDRDRFCLARFDREEKQPKVGLAPAAGVEADHYVGTTPCPQPLPGLTLRNTGEVAVSWQASAGQNILLSPASGTLEPGQQVAIQAIFDCGAARSFQRTLTVTAETRDGGTAQASAPLALRLHERSVRLDHPLGPFAAGRVIALSRIGGLREAGPDDGCSEDHLHAVGAGITIDGQGPFEDPRPSGCGYGRLVWLQIE